MKMTITSHLLNDWVLALYTKPTLKVIFLYTKSVKPIPQSFSDASRKLPRDFTTEKIRLFGMLATAFTLSIVPNKPLMIRGKHTTIVNMKTIHFLLILVSCAASVLAQDPNYLAHGLYHPDILAVLPLANPIPTPGGVKWANSYSDGNNCYCFQNQKHGDDIDDYFVETPKGWYTVRDICKMLGPGPGPSGKPIYNDVQCGNGPPNSDGNEHHCPGRVDIGKNGCGQIGPKWNFDDIATLPIAPPPPPPGPMNSFFLDVGTGDATDRKGLTGETWTHTSKETMKGSTNEQKWFKTHRSGKKFSYVLDGFAPNKKYRVELGFAEGWKPNCSVGKRIQKIVIQNKLVRDKLDVFAEAGCATPYYEIFDGSKAIVANAQGRIRITLEAIEENAMLSTIKIDPATNSPPPPRPPPPRPSPRPPPPAPSPTPATSRIVIDAGSKNEGKTLAEGKTWTYGVASSVVIKNTSQRAKFRTHRSAPKLRYVIPGLNAGSMYTIELGFAEIWRPNCSNGKRVMEIFVNGSRKTPSGGLDVYKKVGCEAAHVEKYQNIQADSQGRLIIEITSIVENAMVSLIEITGAATKNDRITIDVGKDGGDDTSALAGRTTRWGKSDTPNQVPPPYRTHRWGPDFTYTFDGFDPSKTYYVRLGFAEAYEGNCKDGKRRFNVYINDQTAIGNLDVHKQAGGCATRGKYLLRQFERKPKSNGEFIISFKKIMNNPMVSFIEIVPK